MRRKNQVLDSISSIQDELGRLFERIPQDVDERFELWLRIIRGIEKQLDNLENLVELEEEE
tara:strand:+ start:152 stop:334 length:183 start_codon:yes stop_codon:yes gene_type:complete